MLAPSQKPDLSLGGDARPGLQDAFLLWLTANTPDGRVHGKCGSRAGAEESFGQVLVNKNHRHLVSEYTMF